MIGELVVVNKDDCKPGLRVWVPDEASYGTVVEADWFNVQVKLDIDGEIVSCGYQQVMYE